MPPVSMASDYRTRHRLVIIISDKSPILSVRLSIQPPGLKLVVLHGLLHGRR